MNTWPLKRKRPPQKVLTILYFKIQRHYTLYTSDFFDFLILFLNLKNGALATIIGLMKPNIDDYTTFYSVFVHIPFKVCSFIHLQ